MIELLPPKLVIPPVSAALVFASGLVGDLGGSAATVMNVAAIGILVGGFVVVGAMRSTISTKNEIISDLKTERDIERDRAERTATEMAELRVRESRLNEELTRERATVADLQKHNLEAVLAAIEQHELAASRRAGDYLVVMTEIRDAVRAS